MTQTVQITVEQGDRWWMVRIGPDVLRSAVDEAEALSVAYEHLRTLEADGATVSLNIKRSSP